MKKTKILSLLLCLSLFCALIVPGTRAYADNEPDSGMKISKTATANADGSYTITLEAFATGSKVITEQKTDIPTDIVLVIDQSGSMNDPIGGYTYTAYRTGGYNSRNYHNDEYYPLRHNGGSENLWHKLNNNEYIAVSVEQKMVYTAISGWSNRKYYDNQNSLYCLVSGEYKSVAVRREEHVFSADEYWYTMDGQQILYTTGDSSIPNFGQYAPLYQSVKKYTYSYTLNGVTTVIEESLGDGSSPDTQFYRRDYSSSAGGTRLNALKNAATTFANAVAAKAAGADGDISTPADNVNHRIAVVGFASGQYYNGTNYNYGNTEVFVGSNQYKYGSAAQGQYGNAFQDMNTSTGVGNVSASVGALSAEGGTLTNLGLEMGNGIFGANPIAEGEKRNRVVIVFSDGVPGWKGYDSNTANSAITQAGTAKNTYGATVYSIGIFPGADATSAGNQNGNETEKANWFMQRVSSNTQYPQSPSYYLSAADAGTLNSIFQQISDQIETGGTTSTLTSDAVVKDIISPQFTLPAGTTAANITVETYACTGKNANDDYTWSNNNSTMGATASISGDQVNVTGFNFSENYVGTVTEGDSVTYRGHKLVISFKVQPKAGFLGGNEVYTNTSAGIYENGSAENPLLTFDRPTVNVPIKDVTVTAKDKNVYLKGEVTADQLKDGSEISVGDVKLDLSKAADTDKPYGLDPWQAEYVDITVAVKDKDGNVISDKLDNLTEDTTYTIKVTVTPKTTGSTGSAGTPATEKSGENTPAANINVFKPELTFKDSTAYYGETVPANNDYSSNYVANSEKWKNGGKYSTDDGVQMIGTKPTLDITYTPDEAKLDNGKYTKQDLPVKATVNIGTDDVTSYTTFLHETCTVDGCKWNNEITSGNPAFLIHIKTCTLRITKQGGADDESYVFDVYKDGVKYSEVTVWGNSTETLVELPIGTYTISENAGWSWRYSANNGGSAALTAQNPTGSITCVNTKNNNQWLNGFSEVVRNIFGTNH
ncbi:VWA domain-containing protein [Oscillospiraceae bacterium CLA-AA-H272]|uniref:VWA domain-containing protein n=1 Tax=Brotocaccenecus cirricatena TaxID=3064195 RepID=A0AAE3AGJ7_9FIRM|nr:vWA domain-containing protein [Brotocaccenecus cirricatena]MCC2130212.1 VWA domain-containing protein [Brotocaccenecus cirricatena]